MAFSFLGEMVVVFSTEGWYESNHLDLRINMRLIQTFTAFALFVCFSGMAYAEMDGLGFGIVFLIIGIMIIAPPWAAMLIGMYINRKLIQKGYSKAISVAIGLATTLILLSIPFLDYPYKRMKINEYCEKEGGLHVTRMVTGVEGVFNLPYSSSYGYHYFEGYRNEADKTGLHRVYKVKSPTGQNIDQKVDTPSQYGFKMTRSHAATSIYRVDLQTYVTTTDEELGRYTYFESYATSDPDVSLLNGLRFWMRMSCPIPATNAGSSGYYKYLPELLQSTLQPAN